MFIKINPRFFYRKKTYNYEQTNLSKVLSLIDLTALGQEEFILFLKNIHYI